MTLCKALFFYLLVSAVAATTLAVAQTPSTSGFIDKTPRQGFAPLAPPACPSWFNSAGGMGFSIPTAAKTMTRNLAVDNAGNFYLASYFEFPIEQKFN